MKLSTPLSCLLLAAATLLAAPAAQGAVTVQVAGNTASAAIDVSGVSADLILTFDGVQNLSASSLGISARVPGSLELLQLASRLPDTSLTTIPAALPLLITVEPPAAGGLAMVNTVRVEVHTHALPYTAGSHFRLFKAPLGGAFVDITDEVAPGSVRTRGTTGGFSQFLVLSDLRPTATVIAGKFSALRARLADVDAVQRNAFAAQVDAAEAALAAGSFADAIAALDQFRADVSAAAGSSLPNAWSASQRGGNLAGDLQAAAATLRFSIGYLRDFGS
jgi:hypothetical protein